MGGCRNGGGFEKRAKERTPITLEAWMPKKVELTNKCQIFQVEDEKEETIGAIKAEEESGVVRVKVDSGAAKNVWPRRKKRSAEEKCRESQSWRRRTGRRSRSMGRRC